MRTLRTPMGATRGRNSHCMSEVQEPVLAHAAQEAAEFWMLTAIRMSPSIPVSASTVFDHEADHHRSVTRAGGVNLTVRGLMMPTSDTLLPHATVSALAAQLTMPTIPTVPPQRGASAS